MRLLRKLRARRGTTLAEMLASIVVLVMLTVAITTATQATMEVYHKVTATSEAAVLASTITTAVDEQLRVAHNFNKDNATFTCTYGANSSISSDAGYVIITVGSGSDAATYPLLSSAAYTSDLRAIITIDQAERLFVVRLKIVKAEELAAENPTIYYEAEHDVVPLNRI